jgi:hypothetical protein
LHALNHKTINDWLIRYRFVETNGIISQLSGGRPVDDALLAEMGEESWVQVERQVMDAVQVL